MSSKIHQVDENYIKSIYKEINEHIEDYQKDFNKDSEAFDSWSKTICNPKYKLIKNLVYLLEQNETTFHDKQIIFSIFNQLLIINQNVGNQLKKFKYLPKILVEYLLQFKQDNKKIDLCAVSTLSYSFNIEEYKNLLSIELIEIIFDSLIKVKEENVIQNFIRIFIEINYIYKDIKDLKSNLFLQVYNINEHSNLVPEIALRLLNQEKDNEFIIKILFCIKSLMDIKNKDVFYSKDLEVFIDIAITFLESTEINEIRCGIIDVIYNITGFDEFYNIKYKNSEIKDLLEDCINRDLVTQEIQEKSQKILENIDKKMNNK